MKIWLTVIGVVVADAIGNMALRRGMAQIGDVSLHQPGQILNLICRILRNKVLGFGILCITVAFILFLALLSWTDLSFALPATALGSVVNTVGARFILKENVTLGRWMGTFLICMGVSLLSF